MPKFKKIAITNGFPNVDIGFWYAVDEEGKRLLMCCTDDPAYARHEQPLLLGPVFLSDQHNRMATSTYEKSLAQLERVQSGELELHVCAVEFKASPDASPDRTTQRSHYSNEILGASVKEIGGYYYAMLDGVVDRLLSPGSLAAKEGERRLLVVGDYSRSSKLRKEAVKRKGYACMVCEFDFETVFGPIGEEYIHVHHREPLSQRDGSTETDVEKDLFPVCPNCHAMLHKKEGDTPYTIDEMKEIRRNHSDDK